MRVYRMDKNMGIKPHAMVMIYFDLSRFAFCWWMVILMGSLYCMIHHIPGCKIRVFRSGFIGFAPMFCMRSKDAWGSANVRLTETVKLNMCFARSFNSPSLSLPGIVTNRQSLLLNYYLSLIPYYYCLMIWVLLAVVGQRSHFAFQVPE